MEYKVHCRRKYHIINLHNIIIIFSWAYQNLQNSSQSINGIGLGPTGCRLGYIRFRLGQFKEPILADIILLDVLFKLNMIER